jgi:hypothetical protein
MKIQLPKCPTSIKVLKKQFQASADLRCKNAQLTDMQKFVKGFNSSLSRVSNTKIQMVKYGNKYSISFVGSPYTEPWIFVPGISQESINQIKLEILKELGY